MNNLKTLIQKIGADKIKEFVMYWLFVGVGVFILFFLVTTTWIGVDVREKCLVAQGRYDNEDCVESLILALKDEENSIRERNGAIWALGQLGDDRALPVIKEFYTGIIPDREPYDETLSQYEMKKAINLLESDFNLSHLSWNPNDLIVK